MKKSTLVQICLYGGAIVVYMLSSPNVVGRLKWARPDSRADAKTANVDAALADKLPPWRVTGTSSDVAESPAPDTDPYPEPVAIPVTPPPPEPTVEFVQITDSCGPYFDGACVNARSGPGKEFPSIGKLRNGMVLKIAERVTNEAGQDWYRIEFKEPIRYPERVSDKFFVSADYVRSFYDVGVKQLAKGQVASTSKHIVVSLSQQKMFAYDGEELFMEQKVSTGIKDTPTPRGTFWIFKKTPTRYMQGPVPGVGTDYYDLPGVPWNLYFTAEGAIFHGAYWHNEFGKVRSHGCVNLPIDKAEELYRWADLGTKVTVIN